MFDTVNWMAKNGHPSYRDEIISLESIKSETIGEAGRYWQECPSVTRRLALIDAEISEIVQAAEDRYQDWVTD